MPVMEDRVVNQRPGKSGLEFVEAQGILAVSRDVVIAKRGCQFDKPTPHV